MHAVPTPSFGVVARMESAYDRRIVRRKETA
jgi:hypothetical protein